MMWNEENAEIFNTLDRQKKRSGEGSAGGGEDYAQEAQGGGKRSNFEGYVTGYMTEKIRVV